MKQNTPSPAQRAAHIGMWVLLAIYTAIMLRMLIFRGNYFTLRQIDLTPFDTIKLFSFGLSGSRQAFINVWGNIGVFIPLGYFYQYFFRKKSLWLSALIVMLTSVVVEAMQYVLGVGFTDVDDVILNTLGGVLGILLYRLVRRLFAKHLPAVSFVLTLVLFVAAFIATVL